MRPWERGVWSNRHITFIGAEKALFAVLLALFTVYVGEGLVENVIWGRGLAENVGIPSYGGRRSKIVKKKRHIIFERSLSCLHYRLRYSKLLLYKTEKIKVP